MEFDGAEGLQPQRLLTVLRRGRDGSRIRSNRSCAGCLCVREERKARSGLDAFSGVHLLQRVVHTRVPSDCVGCAAGRFIAELLGDIDGRERLPGGEEPERHDCEQQGQIHCAGGRRRAHQGRRGLLHDWRQDGGVDFADGGQGCGGGDRVGQLRVEWMRAGGQAESDRGDADLQADRQAGDQRAGLPADCRRDDGGGDAPAGAGTGSGARQPGTAEGILWTAGA